MSTITENFAPKNIIARKGLDIKPGDVVRVHQKIQERNKTRIQVFEGLVIAVKHGKEPGATFTVRKIASGVGVERIFPLYSPAIEKIEIVKRSRVRRAKLYYIREKVSREIRNKLRRFVEYFRSTEGLHIPEEEMLKEGEVNIDDENQAAETNEENTTEQNSDDQKDSNGGANPENASDPQSENSASEEAQSNANDQDKDDQKKDNIEAQAN